MIDRTSAIELLDRLRGKILSLQTKPRLGDDFRLWHYEVIKALETIFGPDSVEKKEFQQIHFDIHPEILKRSRERIRTILQEQFNISVPGEFEIPQDHYYQERLCEAAEFLLAMIVVLKH